MPSGFDVKFHRIIGHFISKITTILRKALRILDAKKLNFSSLLINLFHKFAMLLGGATQAKTCTNFIQEKTENCSSHLAT